MSIQFKYSKPKIHTLQTYCHLTTNKLHIVNIPYQVG